MHVDDFLRDSAERSPEKEALICGSRRVTYQSLETQCRLLSDALTEAGVRRGDRVAVVLENSVEAVVAIFAILRAGGAFVPISPATKEEKLGLILGDSGATALVLPGERLGDAERVGSRCPHLRTLISVGPPPSAAARGLAMLRFEDVVARGSARSAVRPETRVDLDLAALIYTSGSTGRPKGVALSHLNMLAAATSISSYLEIREDEIIADLLPLSFDYGLYQVLMAFKRGARVVLERSFVYPNVALRLMADEKVTGLPVVPTILALLLRLDLARYDLSALRYVTSTGAALPVAHIQEFRRRLPHVRLFSMYGLTECKRVSYLPPSEIDRRPDSVGRAMPNTEAFIVDEGGERVSAGVVGELVVRGSNVMLGYWGLPEETARVLRPGSLPGERVLHTGDYFRADEEGFLYFVGRRDDIIKSRGEKVSPREVEDALYRIEGVQEAIVVGVPDEILGQAVKAIIVRRPDCHLTEQDVFRHCSRYLEELLVPKHVEFRESLPRTASNKLIRRATPGEVAE
jgi:amino acid adenylation domain-containing protein